MASLVTTTTPPPPTHWSRKDELEKIRSTFHPKEILTCNKSLCSLCFASSPFIRATIRFHLRDNYPEKMAIVELDTPLLASGVGKKLLKACEDRVALCASSNDMQVFNHKMEIVQTCTGTWRWCMSMFGARFAVFVRRARVLPGPCPATRNLSFLRFHSPCVSTIGFVWTIADYFIM